MDRRSLRWPSELESMCTVATGPPPSLGTEAGSRQGKQLDNQVGERERERERTAQEREHRQGKLRACSSVVVVLKQFSLDILVLTV